jgi:signal transduction histidine kinase
LLRDVERIVERSAARMQELLPAYAKVPRDELIPVVRTNTRNLLEAIRDPDAVRGRDEDAYRASGESRARQGITSDEMLNAWRIGLESVREEAHAVAARLQLGTDVLLEFVVATLQWGDVGMRTSALAHHEAEIRELGRLVQEQAALRRVATIVAHEASADEVFAKVAEEVALLLGVEFAAIHRYEPEGDATMLGLWGSLGDALRVGDRFELEGDSTTAVVHRSERPVRIDNYQKAGASWHTRARKAGMRSGIGTPIFVDGSLWGAIVAATSRPEPLPAGAESRIADFTELVATAISNVQARAKVERLAEEQAALRRVATMVAREPSAEEIFVTVAEEVGLLLGAEAAVIHRFDSDGRAIVVGSWGELGDAFQVGSRSKLDGDSVTALVYRTERPARTDGYKNATGSIAADARKLRLRSAVGTPIVVNGRLWGAIGAATSRPKPLPADAESRIAKFTELVATAISNVHARSDLAASRARVVAASDKTRRQIERDLHDGAQQRLVHTVINLKLLLDAIRTEPETVPELAAEALDQAEQATVELRELVHGILPPILTRGGLSAAVETLCTRTPVPVELDVDVGRLPDTVEATAYFLVAEALTNVAKHSRASHAAVKARVENRTLQVEVRDDGVGGARADGTGLVGLSDRLAVLDATLRLESPAGGGTRVAASIPVR